MRGIALQRIVIASIIITITGIFRCQSPSQCGGIVNAQYAQAGSKLVGSNFTGTVIQPQFGTSVSTSSDGSIVVCGAPMDDDNFGAIYVFTRNQSGVWSQNGGKITPAQALQALKPVYFGYSVSVSDDGKTIAVGAYGANVNGAAYVLVTVTGKPSNESSLFEEEAILVGSGNIGRSLQGYSVSLSALGNVLVSGGYDDNNGIGAIWVFSRMLQGNGSSSVWYQVGNKLVGSGYISNVAGGGPAVSQGFSVSISADGETIASGGPLDNSWSGSVWIFTLDENSTTYQQQGTKLLGSNFNDYPHFGCSVALSSDGSVLIVGGQSDNYMGAVWVFTLQIDDVISGGGVWSQQGLKLTSNPSVTNNMFGSAISYSVNADIFVVGSVGSNSGVGSAWIFSASTVSTINTSNWDQMGPSFEGSNIVGDSAFGNAVSISNDGSTIAIGGYRDDNVNGAVWIFTRGGGVISLSPLGVFSNYSSYFQLVVASNYGENSITIISFGQPFINLPFTLVPSTLTLICNLNLEQYLLPVNAYSEGYVFPAHDYGVWNFSLFVAQEPIVESIFTNVTTISLFHSLVIGPNATIYVLFSQLSPNVSDLTFDLLINNNEMLFLGTGDDGGIDDNFIFSFLISSSLLISNGAFVPVTVVATSESLKIKKFPLTKFYNNGSTCIYTATPFITSPTSAIAGFSTTISISGSNFVIAAQSTTYCLIQTDSTEVNRYAAIIYSSTFLTCKVLIKNIGTYWLSITSTGLDSTKSNLVIIQATSNFSNAFAPIITFVTPNSIRVQTQVSYYILGSNFDTSSINSVICILNNHLISFATNVTLSSVICNLYWNNTLFGFQVPLAVSNNANPSDSSYISNSLLITILPPCSVEIPGSILIGSKCLCPIGTQFSPISNYCEPCPSGYYQDSIGSQCKQCPFNMGTNGKLGSTSIANCICNAGYFPDSTSNCVSCTFLKNRATCDGVNSTSSSVINTNNDGVNVIAGYWLSSNDIYFKSSDSKEWFILAECPNSLACVGGRGEENCAVGYSGVVCGNCEDGYGKLGSNTCSKCPSTGTSMFLVILIFFLLIVFCFAIVYFSTRENDNKIGEDSDKWRYLTFSIKIAINHLQILGFSGNFIQVWPEVLLRVFEIPTSAAQINSAAYNIAIDCLTHPSLYTRAMITFFLPLMIILACGIGYLKDIGDINIYINKVKRGVVILLYVAHAGIVEGVFQVMVCYSVGIQSYALSDMRIDCSSSSFKTLRSFAIFYVISYGFGLLFLVYYLILRNTHRELFQFLTDGYKEEMRFWEVITTMRKLILVIISLFASAPLQLFLSQWVLLFSVAGNSKYKPYQRDITHKLELLSLTVLIITVSVGSLFLNGVIDQNGADAIVVSIILILLNFGAVMFVLYTGFSNLVSLPRSLRRSNNGNDIDDGVEMTDSNNQQKNVGSFYKKLLD